MRFKKDKDRHCLVGIDFSWRLNRYTKLGTTFLGYDKCSHCSFWTEGENRTVVIRTKSKQFHNLWQPAKNLPGKGWKSSKSSSQRTIPCCATWWVLRDAWPKWCREDVLYQHGENIILLFYLSALIHFAFLPPAPWGDTMHLITPVYVYLRPFLDAEFFKFHSFLFTLTSLSQLEMLSVNSAERSSILANGNVCTFRSPKTWKAVYI